MRPDADPHRKYVLQLDATTVVDSSQRRTAVENALRALSPEHQQVFNQEITNAVDRFRTATGRDPKYAFLFVQKEGTRSLGLHTDWRYSERMISVLSGPTTMYTSDETAQRMLGGQYTPPSPVSRQKEQWSLTPEPNETFAAPLQSVMMFRGTRYAPNPLGHLASVPTSDRVALILD